MALIKKAPPRAPLSNARQAQNAARWFYWIAGFTLVNAVLAIAGSTVTMLIGLTTPLIGVYIALGAARTIVMVLAIAFAVFVAAGFALLGWLAEKGHTWAFLTGAALYAADAVWSLVYRDWMAALWHAIALGAIVMGVFALRRLKAEGSQPGAVPVMSGATAPPMPLFDGPQGFVESTAPSLTDQARGPRGDGGNG